MRYNGQSSGGLAAGSSGWCGWYLVLGVLLAASIPVGAQSGNAIAVGLDPLIVEAVGPSLGNEVNQPLVGNVTFLFMILEYPLSGVAGEAITTPSEAAQHGIELAQNIAANSYDLASATVDVTPVLAMPRPLSYYQDNGIAQVRADAVALAEQAGFSVDAYDREIIFTQKYWSSSAAGLGTINNRTVATTFAPPANSQLSRHELGHTLGFRHANFWHVLTGNPLSPEGVKIEYGDRFDVMGGVWSFVEEARFSPVLKQRAGWIPSENIQTVTVPGIYTLQSLAAQPQVGPPIDRFTALRIPIDSQANYWVFFRADQPSINYGPVITKSYNRNTIPSLLYDMTPGSLPNQEGQVMDWRDAALPEGDIFLDSDVGIEVENLTTTNGEVVVRVWMNDAIALIDPAPIIDVVSPSNGETVGGVVQYEATAFDLDAGQSNGAGIAMVTLYLHRLSDPLIAALRLQQPPPTPVATVDLSAPPYILTVDTAAGPAVIPDAIYALVVTATDDQGTQNTVWFPHIIDNTGPYIPATAIWTGTWTWTILRCSFRA